MKASDIKNAIICIDKETRQEFARTMRTDPNVWNGINGIGTPPENLDTGKIGGIVKQGSDLLSNVDVNAKQAETVIATTKTDDEGIYSMDVAPGTYDLEFISEGYYDTIISDHQVVTENTVTINAEMTELKI